ncbi:hypothetical protein COT72_01540 [archaeon CG10_big_fil_rev_8_21_14_0_10_43_11]|nr:MAG: hypothetical protein COT72_01540 [archaeon CG10_big_fil_rev_8_21_14_0_10_43_11]
MENNEEKQASEISFKTLKKFEQKYGTRNFLEIALKETTDGNTIITFSKGFTDNAGNKRYRRSLGFEASNEMKKFILDSIKNL